MPIVQANPAVLEFADRQKNPLVLCVDDDPAVLSALRRLFRSEPYEIVTTASPGQAWESLLRHPVAVVISDERMPEASGTELLAAVRERWPWIGLVILTAFPDRDLRIRGLNAGIDRLLSKPWQAESLKRAVCRLVDRVERARGVSEEGTEQGCEWDLEGEGG
jgi:response regulator RpfG family c-di-GMP phosphodiesterase